MAQSDRPTVLPAYDMDQYPKDSDSRLAVGAPAAQDEPASEVRRVDARWQDTWLSCGVGNVRVAISGEALLTLPLDHRAGFLLSRIAGTFDLPTLIELSAMPREEAITLAR